MVQLERFLRLFFFKKFVPKVGKFQGEELGIPLEDARCVLLLASAPAHPFEIFYVQKMANLVCQKVKYH